MNMYPPVKTGADTSDTTHRPPDSGPSKDRVKKKEKLAMQSAIVYAFVVVAVAPLVGIWRGHVWAKANGLVLRKTTAPAAAEQNLTA
jgi:hypothetical protein